MIVCPEKNLHEQQIYLATRKFFVQANACDVIDQTKWSHHPILTHGCFHAPFTYSIPLP